MSPRLTLSCLLILLLAGCGVPEDADRPDPRPAARARAALALAEAETTPAAPDDGSPDDHPDDADDPRLDDARPDPDCPRCRGTGRARTGDGLAEVPCDCRAPAGPAVPADTPAATDRDAPGDAPDAGGAPRVVVFTAPWCAACGPLKAELARAGAGFEVVDVAADPATAAAFGVGAVPTLVRIAGGRETARSVGARDAAGLRRFRDGGP